jgi:hypothetical protein
MKPTLYIQSALVFIVNHKPDAGLCQANENRFSGFYPLFQSRPDKIGSD